MDNMNNKDDLNRGSTTPSSNNKMYKNEHEYTHTNDTDGDNLSQDLKGKLYNLSRKDFFLLT